MRLSLWLYLLTLVAAAGSVQSPNCHQITFWFDPPKFNWIGVLGNKQQIRWWHAKLMFSEASLLEHPFQAAGTCKWVKLEI